MSFRVLVTARSFGSTSQVPLQILANAGCEITKPPPGAKLDEDGMIAALRGADGLIVGTEPVTARVIQASPNLRAIAKHGVGVDNIALSAAQERGIIVANTPGANTEAVAELTIALILALARRIVCADRETRAGSWRPVVGTELARKTLGIVGLGRIGKIVVRRLAGFEMTVLAYDPVSDDEFAYQYNVRYCALDELLGAADFISLHAPLAESTRGMMNASRLAQMKPTAFLINTARGELVDEAVLLEALRGQRIAGTGLDVFAYEPPGASPLFTLENVIVTSHIGAHTTEAITTMSTMAAENLVAALEGRAVPNRIV